MTLLIVLMVIMQFKHFIADYPLQTPYMLGKFKDKDWIKPLSAHCGVHFGFTFIISLFLVSFKIAILCAAIDFTIHFIMDRIKASPNMLGKFEALSKGEFKGLYESQSMLKVGVNHPMEDIAIQSEIELDRIQKRFKGNTYFWWALGLDQLVHHLTDIAVVAILINNL